jgi:hypothetical protein
MTLHQWGILAVQLESAQFIANHWYSLCVRLDFQAALGSTLSRHLGTLRYTKDGKIQYRVCRTCIRI